MAPTGCCPLLASLVLQPGATFWHFVPLWESSCSPVASQAPTKLEVINVELWIASLGVGFCQGESAPCLVVHVTTSLAVEALFAFSCWLALALLWLSLSDPRARAALTDLGQSRLLTKPLKSVLDPLVLLGAARRWWCLPGLSARWQSRSCAVVGGWASRLPPPTNPAWSDRFLGSPSFNFLLKQSTQRQVRAELVQLQVSRSTQKLDARLSVVRASSAAKRGKSRSFLPDQLFPLKRGKETWSSRPASLAPPLWTRSRLGTQARQAGSTKSFCHASGGKVGPAGSCDFSRASPRWKRGRRKDERPAFGSSGSPEAGPTRPCLALQTRSGQERGSP